MKINIYPRNNYTETKMLGRFKREATLYFLTFAKQNTERIKHIDNYLKSIGLEVAVIYLFKLTLNKLIIAKKAENPVRTWSIEIDSNVPVGDYKLGTLINLIESGSLEVRGLGPIFTDSLNYAKNAIERSTLWA